MPLRVLHYTISNIDSCLCMTSILLTLELIGHNYSKFSRIVNDLHIFPKDVS